MIEAAAVLWRLALAALLGALIWIVLKVPAALDAKANATGAKLDAYAREVGQRLDARDRQIGATLAQLNQYVTLATADARSNTDTIAVILRDVAEMTNTINRQILPDVVDLVASIKASLSIVDSLKADLAQLTASTDADLKAVKPVLDNLATLLVSLDAAVQENSPKVQQIADQVSVAIADLDKTLASEDIRETIHHINGVSKSTDIIMQRMSQRAGKLKTIINTLLGAIKINFLGPAIF